MAEYATYAADLSRALDPVTFTRSAGVDPDPWQSGVLRSSAKQTLLCCSRQAGKSTVTAALATHTAIYAPQSLVLLFAPGQRQSLELFRKVAGFYKTAGGIDLDAESTQRLELPNGSRIIALPGNPETVRGFSAPALVVIDEAAFTDPELYYAVRPMLATSGGRLLALTTPFGRRGWFYEAWANGGDTWERVRVTAHQCPRIPQAFLESERLAMPPHRFRSEYLCEFVDTDDQLFASELIAAAITHDVSPLFPNFSW